MKQIRPYAGLVIGYLLVLALLTALAGYTVGIVSGNQAERMIDNNAASLQSYLEKNRSAADLMTEEMREEYIAKTRTVALLLGDTTDLAEDERALEELRVTVNADLISMCSSDGVLLAATDPSDADAQLRAEFLAHRQDTVYTDVLLLTQEADPQIIGASSLEGGGLVQIVYPAQSAMLLLHTADLSTSAKEVPLYPTGITKVLDSSSLLCISSTDEQEIGQTMSYDPGMFRKKRGNYIIRSDSGEKQLLRYQNQDGYILLAEIPYAGIYQARRVVIGWLIAGGMILLITTGLCLRMKHLHERKREAVS